MNSVRNTILHAVECDQVGRIFEALQYYQTGAQDLNEVITSERNHEQKVAYLRRVKEYVERVEEIKLRVRQQLTGSKIYAKIEVPENCLNSSYATIFDHYLDANVEEIIMDEPKLAEPWHIQSLINFLETVITKCPNLKYVRVKTLKSQNERAQSGIFNDIKHDIGDLLNHKIVLTFDIDNARLDPKIILNTGFSFKMGKEGIHYFKYPDRLLNLGLSDFDFRLCRPTIIKVYKTIPFHA